MARKISEVASGFYRRSWDAEGQGDLARALELIDQALEHDPCSVFWATKAQYLLDNGDCESAERAADQAVEMRPDNYHGWTLLGVINKRTREFEKAAEFFTRSLKLKEDHNVYTMLAAVELHFDRSLAIASARKALSLNPTWSEARNVLAAAQALGTGEVCGDSVGDCEETPSQERDPARRDPDPK